MVTLTRFNGTKVTINALLLETVEATPDTLITLTTGKKMVVTEPVPEVIQLVRQYMREVGLFPASVLREKMEGS